MSSWLDTIAPEAVGKFSSIDSLVKILTGRSLLWSRPTKFNEPFDCQPRFQSPELTPELERACVVEFLRVVDGQAPLISVTNPAGRLHSFLATAITEGKIDRNEAVRTFVEGLRESMSPSRNFEKRYFDRLVSELNDVKVLCLTKSIDNILMWSHYADNHRGALIMFASRSNDSQFRLAEPVRYTDDLPFTYDPSVLPSLFSGQISSTEPEMLSSAMQKVVFTKAEVWRYENELRILGGSGFQPEKEVELNTFHMDDVVAVIFGARSDREKTRAIALAASKHYLETKWFNAVLSDDRFGLNLEEVVI